MHPYAINRIAILEVIMMTKTNGAKPQMIEVVEEKENMVVSSTRKMVLAGLGFISWGQDTLDESQDWLVEFFNKLVERGESLEKDGRKMLDDLMKQRKSQAREATDKAEAELDKRLEELLTRMNVPTREDIKELTTRVNALNRKVDELRKTTA